MPGKMRACPTTENPIGEVLEDGFRVPPLLPAWTALEGIVLVKCLDDEGSPSWPSVRPKA
jgi:hypothetical protein